MAKEAKKEKRAFAFLRHSINQLMSNRVILFPFSCIVFIQLLVLEILYFAPRYPLNVFFGPIITKLWSARFLHYPANFFLLPKLYQKTQIPIFIFVSSFFIAMAIGIIVSVNKGKKVHLGPIIRNTLGAYVHVILTATLVFIVVAVTFKGYGLVFDRALEIKSTTGKFFVLKRIIIDGASYFNLLISVMVSTLFAYVLPIIIIEKKRFFQAVILNFKKLKSCFWFTFLLVFVPSLFFIPVLLLSHVLAYNATVLEMSLIIIVVRMLVMIAIDAVVYSALTFSYLVDREDE